LLPEIRPLVCELYRGPAVATNWPLMKAAKCQAEFALGAKVGQTAHLLSKSA
jgi:hypothetical protein